KPTKVGTRPSILTFKTLLFSPDSEGVNIFTAAHHNPAAADDLKKCGFLGACQEYILDKKAPDTLFCQCLQGFCDLKKAATMACTISAFCAIMRKHSWNYE